MFNIKNITRSAFAAVALSIMVPLMIPIGPVPFTLTVFALAILTLLLEPKEVLAGVLVYWVLIALGFPIAVGYKGGIGRFVSVWSGYLWGYITFPIVFILINKVFKKTLLIQAVGLFISLDFLYLFGVFGLMYAGKYTFSNAIKIGIIPFILLDTIKLLLALLISKSFKLKK